MDIARDAMRLMRQSKSLPEIQTYVNWRYGQVAPQTTVEPTVQ